MTLIELMVALAIVAILFAGAVLSVGAITGARAKSAAGELGGVIRSLYDTASLTGRTCRLVFQLPADKDDDGAKYWAECAKGNITAASDRQAALTEANQAAAEAERNPPAARSAHATDVSAEDLEAQERARVDQLSKFSNFTSPEIAARGLSGVKISVWTAKQHDAVSTGLAYLYFFPQGYTERAQIWFRQGKNVWTIRVAPLTGKTSVVARDLEVPTS